MGKSNILGAWGESLAGDYLRAKRYKILAINYRCRYGEIDLIASKGAFLAFVEVKLRKSDKFAQAAEYVDFYKQNRIRTTAEMYLAENATELQPRFDVIEIYAPHGIETVNPVIKHLEDAF